MPAAIRRAAATTLPGIKNEPRLRRYADDSNPSAIAAGRTGATIGATDACEGGAAKNADVGDGIGAIEEGTGAGMGER
jgi:hypothetical protein